MLLALFTVTITIALFAALGGGMLFFRLSRGPIAVSLESQVSKALASRVTHGFAFEVGETDVQTLDGRPALVIKNLVVRDANKRSVLRAPEAKLSVDPLQLLSGTIVPTRLDVRDVTLKLSILPDGDVALSAGSDEALPFRLSEAFDGAAPGPARNKGDAAQTPAIADPLSSAGTSRPDRDVLSALAAKIAPLIDTFTGADDALGGFDRLGVQRGVLVLDDRTHNSVKTFRNLDFDFDRVSEETSRLSLSADGAAGRWSMSLQGSRAADTGRSADFAVENVTLDDFGVVPALRSPGFDTDLALSGSLALGYDAAGQISEARGEVRTGTGYFRLNDPDHEPVNVDRIRATFHLDQALRRIVVDPSEIVAETTRYDFSGHIAPPAGTSGGSWSVEGGGTGVYGAERPGEKPIALDRITLQASFDPDQRLLDIARLSLDGPQVQLALAAKVGATASGTSVKATVTAGRMPAPVILRLWPNLLSAQVRAWLLANMQGGIVEHGKAVATLDDADFAKIRAQHSVADNHLQLDYAVSDVSLNVMNGVPPLRGLNGTGSVTGDTSRFVVSRGSMEVSPGHQLALPDGSLVVPSTDPKPTPATITAHVTGAVDVLAELLARDALKGYVELPGDPGTVKGQIDGVLTVGLNLGGKTKPEELKLGVNAKMANLSIDKLVGKQGLSNGTIALVLDKTGLTAKGDAQIYGAPATIDVRKPAGTGEGSAEVAMTLDEAARTKAGLTLGKSVTGPVLVKITKPLGGSDKKAAIDIDLTRAAVNGLVPGLAKSAGKAGRITLAANQRENGVDLDNIVCDIGAFSARGSAGLDANGGLQVAHLTQVRVSPGDDMKVDAVQGSEGLKLTVRAANLDARPFLKAMSDADTADSPTKDLDLDLHANVLTGQNSQAMTAVDLKVGRRGGKLRKILLQGKVGRAPVSAVSVPQGNVLTVSATSADAGATLLFLDLYKRVGGGRLEATLRMMDGRMDGTATIHAFELREDPAMKRFTEETVAQNKSGDTHIDASNLSFEKLSITFSKMGSKVEVKDGALFSPQMGATVRGSIDFSRDKIALSGTFVPIYGVNNLFSQVPLLGPILGGGAHEGLFGLNYRISGSVASPTLSVDPLSALAPGFLRNIFGAISDAAQGDAANSPATTPDQVAR